MKRQHSFMLGLLVVVLLTSLTGCFGSKSSPPPQNKLTLSTYNLSGSGINPLLTPGGPGSELTSMQIKIIKLELRKDDGSYVKVYEGDGRYIESVGDGLSGSVQFDRPPAGTYTGLRATGAGMKVKAKLRIGETLYYTANQTVDPADPNYHWPMTTSEAEWGYITVENIPKELMQFGWGFPTPLVVSNDAPVDLLWLIDRDYNVVNYDGTDPEHIIFITVSDKVITIVPFKPAKRIDITLTATNGIVSDRANIITLFFDANGALIGGHCQRPANEAFGGSFLREGSVSNVEDNGAAADFDLTFADSGDPMNTGKYYRITGSYDSGTGAYSNVVFNCVNGYIAAGYTLLANGEGAVTLTNLNLDL